ncbi:MAG: hypothetical protein AAB927_03980 [Patescibacteria group bacterium]
MAYRTGILDFWKDASSPAGFVDVSRLPCSIAVDLHEGFQRPRKRGRFALKKCLTNRIVLNLDSWDMIARVPSYMVSRGAFGTRPPILDQSGHAHG